MDYHFEADVTYKEPEEGGRSYVAAGYRPAITFPRYDPPKIQWIMWPIYLDENGNRLADDEPIPRDHSHGYFVCLDEHLWSTVHLPRLRLGDTFDIMEGSRIVGSGKITSFAAT